MDDPPKKKVVFLLTNVDRFPDIERPTGSYLPELAHPWEVMRERGIDVELATPNGGPAPLDPESVRQYKDDPASARFQNDPDLPRLLADTPALPFLRPADYAGVFLVGGHGPVFDCARDERVGAWLHRLWTQNGVIGAVCHGPAGLLTWPDLQGRRVTAFSNDEERAVKLDKAVPFLLEDELRARGATVEVGAPEKEHVVVDGRLVTGQNPASARTCAQRMADLVLGKGGEA